MDSEMTNEASREHDLPNPHRGLALAMPPCQTYLDRSFAIAPFTLCYASVLHAAPAFSIHSCC